MGQIMKEKSAYPHCSLKVLEKQSTKMVHATRVDGRLVSIMIQADSSGLTDHFTREDTKQE